jgi:Holliday junction resolvase
MTDERISRSRKQEQRIAKVTGGSRNAGSGNGWQRKHDVRSGGHEGFLWEMKRTDKKQITIKASDLESVRKIAWQEGRTPVFHIELAGRSYVLLEESDFLELSQPAE